MILGILSDTHSLNIPAPLIERFKTVDLIIHAGDICDKETLKMLKKLAPVRAVSGNMDDPDLKKQLPVKDIILCDKIRIGLTHGHVGILKDALSNAKAAFQPEEVDVVIYGHSHHALKEQVGSVLYFNPGSPNDAVRAKFFSYGIIEIHQGKIKADIVKI